MTIDPHKILGVGKNASPAQIRRAYEELAERYRPNQDGEDNWILEQIQDAYAMLSGDMPPRVGDPPPPVTSNRPGPPEIQNPQPGVHLDVNAQANLRTRKQRVKRTGNKAIIIGTVGGAISALVCGYFLVSYLKNNQIQDVPVVDNSARDESLNRRSRRLPGKTPSQPPTRPPDRAGDQDRNGDRQPPPRDAKLGDSPKNLEEESPDKSAEVLEPQRPSPADESGFWVQLNHFVDRFYDVDQESITARRHKAQREWIQDFRDALEGQRETFALTVRDVTLVNRGTYEVAFATIDTGSFAPDFRTTIDPLQRHTFRKSAATMQEVGTQTRVEVTGNVYISGPDKQLDLSGTQYVGALRIKIRANRSAENVEIIFAVRRPKFNFVNP